MVAWEPLPGWPHCGQMNKLHTYPGPLPKFTRVATVIGATLLASACWAQTTVRDADRPVVGNDELVTSMQGVPPSRPMSRLPETTNLTGPLMTTFVVWV